MMPLFSCLVLGLLMDKVLRGRLEWNEERSLKVHSVIFYVPRMILSPRISIHVTSINSR